MTLVHMASQVPLPDRLYEGRVHLVEVKAFFLELLLLAVFVLFTVRDQKNPATGAAPPSGIALDQILSCIVFSRH